MVPGNGQSNWGHGLRAPPHKVALRWRETWVRVEYGNLCPCDTKPLPLKTIVENDDEFEELLTEHEIEKGILFFEKKNDVMDYKIIRITKRFI